MRDKKNRLRVATVSYTHLDVYKRQPYGGPDCLRYSGASGEKPARQGGRLWYYRSQDHFDVSCGIAGLYGCQLLHGHGGRIMVETELPWTSAKHVVRLKRAEHR